tara:strand:+ start:165 stop:377 length:213 start_codon:yes stop_codon:yes gene_type:complete
LFGAAAGLPGTAAGIFLPGCQTCAGTIVRKPSPAAPGVPAAPEQLFGQVPWRLHKKKEQENQDPLFLLFQ